MGNWKIDNYIITKIHPPFQNPGSAPVTPREHNCEELFQRDLEKKMQMKGYAVSKRYVKPSDIWVGDSVLV